MISPRSGQSLRLPSQTTRKLSALRTVWFATCDPLVAAGVEAWSARVPGVGRLVPVAPDQVVTKLGQGAAPDLVILWLDDPCGLDALAVVDQLHDVALGRHPVAAVTLRRLHPVAKLRLAEAGVRWLADRRWLASAVESLAESAAGLDVLMPPDECALPNPEQLRQRLGFAAHGQLLALMQAAREHPSSVWTSNLPQTKLSLTRGDIMTLRSVAGMAAGLPEPPFTKHACSTKNAPSLPEWHDVKRVVRLAMGLPEQP